MRRYRAQTWGGGAVVVLLVLALAPQRATAWAGWLRGPVETILAPGARPLAMLSTLLRPGRTIDTGRPDASELELQRQREELETELARANARIAELEQLVRDLQVGAAAPGLGQTRPVVAARVGQAMGSGTIDVRAGDGEGVVVGTVATARGTQQLVGLVTSTGPMVSTVRLITDRRIEPGLMQATIGAEGARDANAQASLPRCQLHPDGAGLLVDEQVPAPPGSESIIRVGALVRLDDPTWSGAAQLLILGRIERIEDGASPQFRKIVVRPIVDISRVSGVILHVRRNDDEGQG
ncbi:MAG: hypothetical protein KDA20_11475 [Phycisphaerales bacterium]|nr:hypothetical protein [Phycisphaerales bacterium]